MLEIIISLITALVMINIILFANFRYLKCREEMIGYTMDEVCEKNSRADPHSVMRVEDLRHLLERRLGNRFTSDYVGLNPNWKWRW